LGRIFAVFHGSGPDALSRLMSVIGGKSLIAEAGSSVN
jgi:hypothetical protein